MCLWVMGYPSNEFVLAIQCVAYLVILAQDIVVLTTTGFYSIQFIASSIEQLVWLAWLGACEEQIDQIYGANKSL